jgi:hypothetical protein
MFTNDKGSPWIYTFDARCPYGVHQLKIRIEDIVGNVTERDGGLNVIRTRPRKRNHPPRRRQVAKLVG